MKLNFGPLAFVLLLISIFLSYTQYDIFISDKLQIKVLKVH